MAFEGRCVPMPARAQPQRRALGAKCGENIDSKKVILKKSKF